ncbi:MAG TPA: tyrosinase family protein [Mycobacteriales bacterium]|nr:tyrosinase family protein [Mycobacteriales bacterium]
MGVRKNAKLLTAAEREAFVQACVLMKADIVNPGAPAADQYSKWDELVAIHRMIQNANAPGAPNVNFGHGGLGAFSFLSWHRYFLHVFEQRLQGYVPGVMLPYWDWTDPAPLLTDTFLGPNGVAGTNVVSSGYFAPDAPGTGGNPTPIPVWWPAGLTGWNLANGFGTLSGPLRRRTSPVSGLPSVTDLQTVLARATYSSFQNTLEGGAGLASGNQLHNGLHGWVGGPNGHMSSLTGSPFDPIFYLHHCNIDRLWAMWQLDGHADEYPVSGGSPQHHRNDIMYPWTGGAPGYSSNLSFGAIVMPDFSALGAQRNVDTLDHRALGYTYDCLPVIGLGLDRTGSMLGMTPDPMTVAAPDVTKWEAAKRGVSAFLQDCETVYASGVTYVTAGVKTFRSLGTGNDFTPVFPGTPYGLVKNGGAYSRAVFDSAVAGLTPGGGTPLADALTDVQNTLVTPPFGSVPADEQRYLAMLTDGLLTSGSPLASIPDGSLATTAIFAMGFGTAADVDYATLASVVAKGRTLPTGQVFHGENAGTIDKFYSNALAQALGFTAVFDPALELFAGEHVHLDLSVTSADDAVLLTAQGMDFVDENWSFMLLGPDGEAAYGDGMGHGGAGHGSAGHGMAMGPRPHVTARRATGRLSLLLQRDNADHSAWVGNWRLMAAYRAPDMGAMVMADLGELMYPVAAGPVRGPRWSRLLRRPTARQPARSIVAAPRHRLDIRPAGTNNDRSQACSLVVNFYARTRLRLELVPRKGSRTPGKELAFDLSTDVLAGTASVTRTFARLVAPSVDLRSLASSQQITDLPRSARIKGARPARLDQGRVLAEMENKEAGLGQPRDEELHVVRHGDGPPHVHIEDTTVAGPYHVGMYVEGTYCPDGGDTGTATHQHEAPDAHAEGGAGHDSGKGHDDGSTHSPNCVLEHFGRLLTASAAIEPESR